MSPISVTSNDRSLRRLRRQIHGYFMIARPVWLLKTVFAVGWGQYCANGNHINLSFNCVSVIWGMVGIWAGLYGLNDIMDQTYDKTTRFKRFRPLTVGILARRGVWLVSVGEIIVALVLLSLVRVSSLFGVALLIANQLVYTLE